MAQTQYRFPTAQADPGALDALDDPHLLAFLAAAVDLADYAAEILDGTPIADTVLRERVEAFRVTSIVYGGA